MFNTNYFKQEASSTFSWKVEKKLKICLFYLQKYEMIKTEDIPHLENSTFSTRVVKDIAQNILSFLKSNCTKEGHTYWLFKGNV